MGGESRSSHPTISPPRPGRFLDELSNGLLSHFSRAGAAVLRLECPPAPCQPAPHPGNSLAMTLCSCMWPPGARAKLNLTDGNILICYPGDYFFPPPHCPGGQVDLLETRAQAQL